MASASSRPGAGNDLPCGFCPSLRAPYTCPRCLLRFCSVPCYNSHGSCARDFRDRELRLRLQGLRVDEASRGRLREALWRLRELREPGDEQARIGLGPEEEELWEELTPEEQKAFRKLLLSGGAASLVPLWTPWWETGAPSGLVQEVDPQNPPKAGGRDLTEERDPQKPLGDPLSALTEERGPQDPLEGEERTFGEETDPRDPLRGAFGEETDLPNPLEAEERVFMGERGLRAPLRGDEGSPKSPAKPLCEAESSRLLSSIPPVIPPLSSFRISVSPSVGFQLPGVLYGYVYAFSLYNGDVEEEEVLLEFCETLLDVSPSLGSPQRVYGSVSEALQDASRSVMDHRYPECPLGRGGAMAAVARLLSHKAFLLAALCHLCKLLRKGRKRMADSDRSRAFRAGKKCAFLLSWANENEGQLPLLALAAQEEGRGQREAGQEMVALRRGLERKWRGKRPPMEKKEKALIEELD